MYIKHLTLYNLEETIVLPIVRRVIKDLVYLLNIDSKSIIKNHIMTEDITNTNYNISNPNRRYILSPTTKIEMTYTEESNIEGSSSVDSSGGRRTPFLNYKNNFNFSVKTLPSKLTISMKVSSKNKSEISKAKNSINTLWISGRDVFTHSAKVRYYPDPFVLKWISSLHKQMNIKHNKEIGIEDFISVFASSALKIAIPSTGDISKSVLSLDTTMRNMLGRFIDIKDSTIEYDKDSGYYSCNIEYSIEYDKPYTIVASYESVINNVVIGDEFIGEPYSLTDEEYYGISNCSAKGDILSLMRRIKNYKKPKQNFINVPAFDKFNIPSDIGETILSVLTTVTEDNDVLFDLTDISDIHINALYLDYIQREGDNIFNPYRSLIYIELQENNKTTEGNIYLEGTELKIKHINPSSRYRVLINVITDTKQLPPSAFDNLRFSFEELNNRRFITNSKVTRCIRELNIPDDVLSQLEDVIRLNDKELGYHMLLESNSNKLTILSDAISNLVEKLKSGEVFLSNVSLSPNDANNHVAKTTRIINHWRWSSLASIDGVVPLTSEVYRNNVKRTTYEVMVEGNKTIVDILDTKKYSIFDMSNNHIELRCVFSEDIGIVLFDNSIFIIKDIIYSLTDYKRFVDIFDNYMINLDRFNNRSLEKRVMMSSILALGLNELKTIKEV